MIEWIKFDKDDPPEVGTSHITIGTTGIIRHGHYNYSFGGWLDKNGDEIRFITHYAEINLPEE